MAQIWEGSYGEVSNVVSTCGKCGTIDDYSENYECKICKAEERDRKLSQLLDKKWWEIWK